MSRTLGVCWIFLWISSADAYYAVSNETTTWHNATNRGYIATPEIKVNNSTLTVNITSDLDEQVWVGYYQKETAFAYIGCARDSLNNVSHGVLLEESSTSPGLCYSLCNKSNFIGLNQDKCICMSQKPNGNKRLQKCHRVLNGYWMVGEGNDYIAIYERVNKAIHVKNNFLNAGNCLAFQDVCWWKLCSSVYRVFCKKSGKVFIAGHPGHQLFKEWWNYVQICFENNSQPVTYKDITPLNKINTSSESWTNVIRSNVIYHYTESSKIISPENVMEYGYITKHGNLTVLSFTNSTNSIKRYLLQTIPVPETKPTSEQARTSTNRIYMSQSLTTIITKITPISNTGYIPNTTTSSKGPNSISTSTSSVNDGLLNSSETFQSNPQKSTSESSDVSVPVSISVVAVIIVAVIVTIITLQRRGKFQGICTKESAIENSCNKINAGKIQREENVYNESPVDNYDQISEFKDNNNLDVKQDLDVENGEYGHTYFILEPGSRESHTDGNISDSRIDGTEMNDDYNILHLNKTFGAKADDTYDTTEKAAIKLKALQNTGCEKEFLGKLNENEEDTYNHISRNLLKNNKTDNIYGVTDNQENDYGDVNNGCEKNLRDGDDTYSHLNTTH